jgi:hypothetical protein
MSLMDIIYEMKRLEKEEELAPPEPAPETVTEPEPAPEPETEAVTAPEPEPVHRVFRPSFWSRLACEEEDD